MNIGDLFDSPWKLLIVAAVVIILFGTAKLPLAARSLGKSMRILKSEMSTMHKDDDDAPVVKGEVPAPKPQHQIEALQQQVRDLQQQQQAATVGAKAEAASQQPG